MKFKSKIPRVKEVEGQICSVCFYAISNHIRTIMEDKSKRMAFVEEFMRFYKV